MAKGSENTKEIMMIKKLLFLILVMILLASTITLAQKPTKDEVMELLTLVYNEGGKTDFNDVMEVISLNPDLQKDNNVQVRTRITAEKVGADTPDWAKEKTTTQLPPKEGSNKWILIIVLVLLAVVGGAVWWRNKGKSKIAKELGAEIKVEEWIENIKQRKTLLMNKNQKLAVLINRERVSLADVDPLVKLLYELNLQIKRKKPAKCKDLPSFFEWAKKEKLTKNPKKLEEFLVELEIDKSVAKSMLELIKKPEEEQKKFIEAIKEPYHINITIELEKVVRELLKINEQLKDKIEKSLDIGGSVYNESVKKYKELSKEKKTDKLLAETEYEIVEARNRLERKEKPILSGEAEQLFKELKDNAAKVAMTDEEYEEAIKRLVARQRKIGHTLIEMNKSIKDEDTCLNQEKYYLKEIENKEEKEHPTYRYLIQTYSTKKVDSFRKEELCYDAISEDEKFNKNALKVLDELETKRTKKEKGLKKAEKKEVKGLENRLTGFEKINEGKIRKDVIEQIKLQYQQKEEVSELKAIEIVSKWYTEEGFKNWEKELDGLRKVIGEGQYTNLKDRFDRMKERVTKIIEDSQRKKTIEGKDFIESYKNPEDFEIIAGRMIDSHAQIEYNAKNTFDNDGAPRQVKGNEVGTIIKLNKGEAGLHFKVKEEKTSIEVWVPLDAIITITYTPV